MPMIDVAASPAFFVHVPSVQVPFPRRITDLLNWSHRFAHRPVSNGRLPTSARARSRAPNPTRVQFTNKNRAPIIHTPAADISSTGTLPNTYRFTTGISPNYLAHAPATAEPHPFRRSPASHAPAVQEQPPVVLPQSRFDLPQILSSDISHFARTLTCQPAQAALPTEMGFAIDIQHAHTPAQGVLCSNSAMAPRLLYAEHIGAH